MLTKQQAVTFLLNEPYKFGHMLGFKDLGELHNHWIREMLTAREDRTLQAHRNSYKTTCVSIALALIMILLPNKRTLFCRKTDTDVKEIVKQVRNILLHPKTQYFVMCIWGKKLELTVDNSNELSTNLTTDIKGTSQLVAVGTQSSVTGKHYDYIFTDDIINTKDRVSRAEREKTKTFYRELNNVKMLGTGRIFNTGTPWHVNDAFEIMPEPEKFDCYTTGIMTEEMIAEKKLRTTKGEFCANYELRHVPSDDVLFTEPMKDAPTEMAMQGESHVDAAYYGEDWTAYTTLAIHDGKYYVYGRCWRKHIDDVEAQIVKIQQEMKAGKMHMELNADKGYAAKQFRADGLRVATYHESQNKYIKISSHLKSEWPDVIFVKGTDPKYIEQICDYNEDAEHDDCPDSLASLIRIMSRRKNATTYGLFMY